jgi:hypothetical protein
MKIIFLTVSWNEILYYQLFRICSNNFMKIFKISANESEFSK